MLLFNRGSTGCDLLLPGPTETRWKLLFDSSGMISDTSPHHGFNPVHVEGASLVCLELASGPAVGPDYC